MALGVISDYLNLYFVCSFFVFRGVALSAEEAFQIHSIKILCCTWRNSGYVSPRHELSFITMTYLGQFSFFNNFSGQIAYESWTLSLYNVVFTVLPPLVIGVFDQFVSARILDRYPQLYILGQKNQFFTKTAFWLWVGNALYHSIVSLVLDHIQFLC